MSKNLVETILGALVIILALLFALNSYQYLEVSNNDDYFQVKANFYNIGSLSKGSDVRLGGVKIGVVSDISLNKKTLSPVVTLNILKEISLPNDSRAMIKTTSLIGSKYIYITPGGSASNFKNNDIIKYTQDALDLEDLINKFAFGSISSDSESKSQDSNGL